MRIVVATKNNGKLKEFRKILTGHEVLSQTELGITADILEDGQTFEENALKKAREIARLSDALTVADDSGLVVDYLDGQPGIYSARFAGEPSDDERNIDKLLSLLEGVPTQQRTARFVSVIAARFPDGREIVARGECEGLITTQRCGSSGFGYDPVFYVSGFDKTFAEMPDSLKNEISHRALALQQFKLELASAENIVNK